MKKIISIVLLLSLCLGLFAGCTPTVEPQQPASNLENAKSLVFNTYKPANKDEIPFKSVDFEVMTSVLVDGETFPVAWTVEVTEGPAEAVQIVDGSSEAFKKVDLTEKPEVDVKFTLTATISDAEGNTATVSFKYQTPKFEAPSAEKIVLKIKDIYITGTEYLYTGKMKYQLETSDKIADAIAFTMIENADGTNSFKTDDGYFLFCDANHVQFVTEESDNTKFVLEVADGGYFIKCAVANYNGKAQYLEYYSNYLTCYGMGSDASIYTFALEAADGANGKVVKYSEGGSTEPTEPTTPSEPSTFGPAADAVAPVAGTAYKLGLVHGTNAKTYYISGGMAQTYYLATNEAAASGLDAYIEAATNGYYLYVMENGAKKYINMTVSGTHVNAVYSETAETVYTYDETLKTLKVAATVEGETADYILGTSSAKTFTTVGFCAVSSEPFYCQFFAINGGSTEPSEPTEPEATEPAVTEPAATDKVVLTVDSLGLASQSYSASTATVGGVGFQWIQLGNYGDGIQVRDKDGKTSMFWNTTAFGAPISKIELVYSTTKDVTHSNPDSEIFSFGNGVDNYTYSTKLSTTAGVKTYTITPDAETYTFMKFEHDLGYSMYWASITIYLADGTVVPGTPSEPEATEPEATEPTVTEPAATNKVELTVDSLGLASQSYSASTATVGGVGFQWIQLGNYGDGIQVRDKDGKTSMFWNTTAFGAPISKIELVYSTTKDVTHSNPDSEIFSFGNGVDNYTYSTKLSTTAGVKTYTITPDAETYTFMKFEHDLGYSMYWASITIYLVDGTVVSAA